MPSLADYDYGNIRLWGNKVDLQDTIISGTPLTGWLWANNTGTADVSGNAEITNDDVFIYPAGMNILDHLDDVQNIIDYHDQYVVDKYNIKNDYYKGRHHTIITRHGTPLGKPDNRNTINLPKELVDSFNSFGFSNLVKMSYVDPNNDDNKEGDTPQEESVNKAIKRWTSTADLESFQSEVARTSSIYGRAYAYAYKWENSINVSVCTPEDTIVVYDDTIRRAPMFAIRYDSSAEHMSGTIITLEADYQFSEDDETGDANAGIKITNWLDNETDTFTGQVQVVDQHPEFSVLPVIELYDNPQRLGIFDDNMNNIDTINSIISNKANDTNSYKNNILLVSGVKLDKEAKKELQEKNLINLYKLNENPLDQDQDKTKPTAEFIAPTPHDDMQENTLNRLIQNVYSTACVVNLEEKEALSRAATNSGIAIKERYSKMMGKAKEKSNYFSRLYRQLIQLFFDCQSINADIYDIQFTYGYEEPQDEVGQAQAFNYMFGKTPNHIAYQAVPSVIDDPVATAQEYEQEQSSLQAEMQQMTSNQLGDSYNDDNEDSNGEEGPNPNKPGQSD